MPLRYTFFFNKQPVNKQPGLGRPKNKQLSGLSSLIVSNLQNHVFVFLMVFSFFVCLITIYIIYFASWGGWDQVGLLTRCQYSVLRVEDWGGLPRLFFLGRERGANKLKLMHPLIKNGFLALIPSVSHELAVLLLLFVKQPLSNFECWNLGNFKQLWWLGPDSSCLLKKKVYTRFSGVTCCYKMFSKFQYN